MTYIKLHVTIDQDKGRGYKKVPMPSKEMIKLRKKNGFLIISQNGSHMKLKNAENGRTVIVPCHAKDLKKELEQEILKQAGLK